jgi:hypothetical protein
VVVDQPIALGLKVSVPTRFTVTALLVPADVTTVTLTVPGTVKFVAAFPVGTIATSPVSDHAEVAGTTSTEMLPCVKVTFPGAVRKRLPLISIGRLTGLVGVVELLIFWICGRGGSVVVLPPLPLQPVKKVTPATSTIKPVIIHFCCLIVSSSSFQNRLVPVNSACIARVNFVCDRSAGLLAAVAEENAELWVRPAVLAIKCL